MSALSRSLRSAQDHEESSAGVSIDHPNKLAPGHYVLRGRTLVRTGDAQPLTRWHGTQQPHGNVIETFIPKPAGYEGRPAYNAVPGVYTSVNAGAAEQYSHGASVNASARSNLQGQIYELSITPNVVVDVGTGENDEAVRAAIAGGADVLEAPDFGEQPETLVVNPGIIRVVKVEEAESYKDLRTVAPASTDVDRLRQLLIDEWVLTPAKARDTSDKRVLELVKHFELAVVPPDGDEPRAPDDQPFQGGGPPEPPAKPKPRAKAKKAPPVEKYKGHYGEGVGVLKRENPLRIDRDGDTVVAERRPRASDNVARSPVVAPPGIRAAEKKRLEGAAAKLEARMLARRAAKEAKKTARARMRPDVGLKKRTGRPPRVTIQMRGRT